MTGLYRSREAGGTKPGEGAEYASQGDSVMGNEGCWENVKTKSSLMC